MIQYMICMQAYFWYKEKQVTLLWLTLYNLNIDYSFYLKANFLPFEQQYICQWIVLQEIKSYIQPDVQKSGKCQMC